MRQQEVVDVARKRQVVDDGLCRVSIERTGCEEHFITATFLPFESPQSLFERAAAVVDDTGGAIVSLEVAGIAHDNERSLHQLAETFGPVAWPITWVDRRSHAAPIGGVQIWAVTGPAITPLLHRDIVVGTRFEDPWATYCRLGGLAPANTSLPPHDQALSIMHVMEATLQSAGMEFADVVRTWFYNRNIATWYDDFNRARSQFFVERGTFSAPVPASTGVGNWDVGPAALTGGLLAIRAKSDLPNIVGVSSPLQCSALDYGSAFSRAIEAAYPDHTRLLVSGTASISSLGDTEHPGDIEGQTLRTFEVVEALLESRLLTWEAVTSGIAYVKREEDISAVRKQLTRIDLDQASLLIVQADICRDALLFELEVEAVAANSYDKHGSR